MPSIASHFVVATKVANILKINNDNFMLGNILPDIIDGYNSHFKIKGDIYLIPNINAFIKNNKYDKFTFLGYLTHLLLDKYFLEKYVPNNISNYDKINLFSKDKIYKDYTHMNKYLVDKYKIDLEYINKIMNTNKYSFIHDKYIHNISSINNMDGGEINFINIDTLCDFFDTISIDIANYINRWC